MALITIKGDITHFMFPIKMFLFTDPIETVYNIFKTKDVRECSCAYIEAYIQYYSQTKIKPKNLIEILEIYSVQNLEALIQLHAANTLAIVYQNGKKLYEISNININTHQYDFRRGFYHDLHLSTIDV